MCLEKTKLVVVDVDDVLIDLNDSVADMLSLNYKDFKSSNVVTFDLNKNISVEELPDYQKGFMANGLGCPRNVILNAYTCLDVFKNAKLTYKVREGLKLLSENFHTIIHTNNFSLEIAAFKIDLLKNLCSDLVMDYNICVGNNKPVFDNVYAVFEDCVGNIAKYSDDCKKYLINRPHNREVFNREALSIVKNLRRVENFYTGVKELVQEG